MSESTPETGTGQLQCLSESNASKLKSVANILSCCFFYTKPRLVTTKLRWYAVILRVISFFAIFVYIVIGQIILKEGYAEFANDGQSVVFTKLRGFLETKFTKDELDTLPEKEHLHFYNRFWDANDRIYGARSGSFFIATNLIITPNQKLSNCEDTPNKATICESHDEDTRSPCKLVDSETNSSLSWEDQELNSPKASGEQTGKCLEFNNTTFTCEYRGWCPPQSHTFPSSKQAIFNQSRKFTAQIQNKVNFPKFKLELTNNKMNSKCLYNPARHEETKYCRNFIVEDMLNKTGHSFDELAMRGGMVRVEINWSCSLGIWRPLSLDWSFPQTRETLEDTCLPTYKFTVLEGVGRQRLDGVGGWHKKTQYYYPVENDWGRTLYNVYGLYMQTEVTFKLSRFDPVNTMVVLLVGSGYWAAFNFIFWLVFSGFFGNFKNCFSRPCCSAVDKFNNDQKNGWKTKEKFRVKSKLITSIDNNDEKDYNLKTEEDRSLPQIQQNMLVEKFEA